MTARFSPALKAILFDLSGVLYIGTQAIPSAVDAIRRARKQGYTLRFVTNTASQSSDMILQQLHTLGFDFSPSELFTAPRAAKAYIQQHQLRPYCLIHPNLKTEFTDIDQTDPNCVLLGDAQDGLNYHTLNQAFNLVEAGFPLIGIGKNKYYKDAEGFKLDAGVFIHALEWASGVEAIIMGKPDRAFFEQVVASTGFQPEECLMIGDDVIGDVQGAMDAGLQASLVRTGKYKPSDEALLPENAHILDSIADLQF